MAGGFADEPLHLDIFADFRAALRSDLQIRDPIAPARISDEEALEGFHPLHDALAVIEPIDADQYRTADEAVVDAADNGRLHRPLGPFPHLLHVHADRENAEHHGASI